MEDYPFGYSNDLEAEHIRFWSKIATSRCEKLFAPARDVKSLYRSPRICPLLADATLFSGGDAVGKGESINIRIIKREALPKDTTASLPISAKGTKAIWQGFLSLPAQVLDRWRKDSRKLIESGRLYYLPERIVMWSDPQKEKRHWQVERVSVDTPLNYWQTIASHTPRSRNLILDQKPGGQTFTDVMAISLPFIEGVSLSELANILDAENDQIAGFRKQLKATFSEIEKQAAMQSDQAALKRAARDIRGDIVEPELEKLDRTFRRIVNVHSIKVGGAAVATAVLAVTAASTSGLAATAAQVFGAGGFGMMAKEYADYRERWHELRDNP